MSKIVDEVIAANKQYVSNFGAKKDWSCRRPVSARPQIALSETGELKNIS